MKCTGQESRQTDSAIAMPPKVPLGHKNRLCLGKMEIWESRSNLWIAQYDRILNMNKILFNLCSMEPVVAMVNVCICV